MSLNNLKKCLQKIGNVDNILTDETARKKAKNCYKIITGKRNINDTSLVLLHTPVVNNWDYFHTILLSNLKSMLLPTPPYWYTNIEYPNHFLYSSSKPAYGQLLTGDLDLTDKYCEFQQHMSKKLNSISTCLLPHHGSYLNWNTELINDAINCHFWIASAGINNNRYKHPSISVIKDIAESGNLFFWVNDYSDVTIQLIPKAGCNYCAAFCPFSQLD